jgi:hypothetical protein
MAKKLQQSKKILKGSSVKNRKEFVNLQSYKDKDGVDKFYCGYKVGKKYKEQDEHYNSPEEARQALKN